MRTKYLFPNRFKKLGWLILIPVSIIGIYITVVDFEPAFLNLKLPALFIDEFMGEKKFIGLLENNFLNEIVGVLLIISSLLVAFSAEKEEDEYIAKIRLESLVWAVYINYGILLLSILFIYDLAFFWVMIFNMFTILWFFIFRFNWQKSKL